MRQQFKNKIINKKLFTIFLLICVLMPFQNLLADFWTGDSDFTFCASEYFKSLDNVFQNYQSHEYVNGLLKINYKLVNKPVSQSYYVDVYLYDSKCNDYWKDYYKSSIPAITFPPNTENFSLRFLSPTHFVIWNDDQNEQFQCSICNVDFGQYNYPEVTNLLFQLSDSFGRNRLVSGSLLIKEPIPIPNKTPVLIVPGITGTEMKKGNELLWADINRMLNPFLPDSFMDPLKFNEDLTPSDSGVSISNVISSIIGFDYTDGLIQEFIDQGYIENQTLFTFPYDWRYGVSGKYADGSPNGQAGKTNSDLLKEKIDQILQNTGANKIDIVAHSMGGLIVKKYVADDPVNQKINKAIFIGVPNTGSVKAVKGLLWGDNMGVYFGPLGLSDSEMKKISANMPGVYDLLPSEQLYNRSSSFLQTIDYGNNAFTFPQIPVGGNVAIKDLNYQEYKSFMTQENNLNQTAFLNSENLHTQAFNDFDLRTTGIDLYAIDGCKTATMTKLIQAKGKNILGYPLRSYAIESLDVGDGTVSIESSTNLPINQSNKYYSLIGEHSKLLSGDGSRQQIVNLITGSNLNIDSNLITQDISQCQLNGKAIEVFSPVDITVVDQFGNKLGLAQDGSLQNNITNASFDILGNPASTNQGGHKFIFLPTDNNQTYTISMQGTGIGIYTINVKDIQNTQETKVETFSNLPVTESLTGTINLGNIGSPTTLTVKQSPSSQAQVIYPDQPDTTPPEVIIEFDPIKKDLKFSGKDNISKQDEITITDKDNIITLTDKAGNVTEITLKDKNRKITMKAEIKSIKYNGKLADTSNNQMNFLWLYDKKQNLKMLTQRVMSKNGYNIFALYNGSNTTLLGKDKSGYITKTEKGLKILRVTTNNGNLSWSY